MKIGIIVAMDKELAQLQNLLSTPREEQSGSKNFITGCIGPHEVILQKCGIGKVNAAVGAVEMIDRYHPDLIVSTGCAGGADTHLKVTDVVVGTHYTYHDVYCGSEVDYGQFVGMPALYEAGKEWVEKALHLNCSTTIHGGLMVSGDWFVDSREKMRKILSHFPDAKAVDMESCAIAQTCYLHGVPFVSFRVISDVPLSDEKASQYYDFWSRMADGSFEVTKTFIEAL
ncbi:MAG: 5'-methylthioadenosine/adenosylhomocysteine nucleosidase [Prevotella sp.]|nr:5'-methylthioadenosine/adenosylhomocysteine nucleosidase [Prevotella sp.]